MNKRGISPLIVSAILFGLVLVLGTVVYIWTSEVFETVGNQKAYSAEFINFELRYLNKEICADSVDHCTANGDNIDYYCLLIENKENFPVQYVIKTIGKKGISISEDCETLVEPLNSKVFRIDYDINTIGNLDYAEVLPYRYS